MMKKTLILTTWSVLTLMLSACHPSEEQNTQTAASGSSGNQAASSTSGKPVYFVGSEMSKFPVVMHDGRGKVTGFEAELLQAIADKQGFEIKYNIDNWERLLHKLGKDQTDILLGSVTITEDRKQNMDFTQPVLSYQTGVMVRPELANIKKFSDLRGKKVNLRKNTVYEQMVPIFSVGEGDNMVYPENVWGQIRSLMMKQSEAMVGASITLEYYKNQYKDQNFHIIYEPNSPKSYYGWAVQKGNTALLNKLNTGLSQAKKDGTYENLYKKYWPNVPYTAQ